MDFQAIGVTTLDDLERAALRHEVHVRATLGPITFAELGDDRGGTGGICWWAIDREGRRIGGVDRANDRIGVLVAQVKRLCPSESACCETCTRALRAVIVDAFAEAVRVGRVPR